MTKRRHRTLDRGDVPIHTVEQLGPKQSLTPEGFLLCEDVPLARTGVMLYTDKELPLEGDEHGVLHITRDAEALFAPETIASFNGKPVVDTHPDEDVNPKNWRKLAGGFAFNVRRGTGDDSDVLLCDLLVTDEELIRQIKAKKREVSAGYDASYEQTGIGTGNQTNIIGNHIALVERGRCGPRCAIGDHLPPDKENPAMGTKTTTVKAPARRPVNARLRQLFRDAAEDMGMDTTGMETALAGGDDDGMDGGGGGDTHVHVHMNGDPAGGGTPGGTDQVPTQDDPVESRFQAIEQTLSQIMEVLQGLAGGSGDPAAAPAAPAAAPAPAASDEPPADDGGEETKDADPDMVDGDDKDKTKTMDSAALAKSFQTVLSDAEILVPGFRMPTFDSKQPRKATMDSMCRIRKSVLSNLVATTDGASIVRNVSGSDKFDVTTADCATTAVVFRAAAGAKRLLNNQSATRDMNSNPHTTGSPAAGGIKSIADLNAYNQQFYAAK